jgi:formylglycine-generating enzyme required for sulfatase activity
MIKQSLAVYAASTMFFAAFCMAARAGTVQIDLLPVGDAGNVSDPLTGYGSVGYSYSMGKYDVTMGQYTTFLNSVATSSDQYGLYNTSMATATPTYGITRTSTSAGFSYALASTASANVPVTEVSWGDVVRFVNWLQNGEPTGPEGPGTTETGTYTLNGGTSNAALLAVTRGPNANWILPNVNEWYKSAYYSGGGTNSSYWTYATQSNNVPSNVLSATGTNNANFTLVSGLPPVITRTDPANWLTPVGAFSDSPGPYGTFDQQGDAYQWMETKVGGSYNELRGGSWDGFADDSSSYGSNPPIGFGAEAGFRVAYVPEPSAGALLFTGATFGVVFVLRLRLLK